MRLSIVHPMDPWIQGLGGFDTCIDGIIRYAPDKWDLEVIGISRNTDTRPPGKWFEGELADRLIRFYPVLAEPQPDIVRPVPLSLRFVLRCRMSNPRSAGQVVHFHRPESGYAITLAKPQHAVYFFHNHPGEVVSEFSDLRWKRLGWLFSHVVRNRLQRADTIVAIDPRTKSWVDSLSNQMGSRTHWLPQWADPILFNPAHMKKRAEDRRALRAAVGLRPDAKVIGFAGRLERQKDPLLLLEAFGLLAAELKNAALIYVGSGRMSGPIEDTAQQMQLSRRVRVIEPVARHDLAGMYRGFDVTVCSSGFESGPRAVFESLACGTPVASFDVGQVADVLGTARPELAGCLLRERAAKPLAGALRKILSYSTTEDRVRQCALTVATKTPQAALGPLFERYRAIMGLE